MIGRNEIIFWGHVLHGARQGLVLGTGVSRIIYLTPTEFVTYRN